MFSFVQLNIKNHSSFISEELLTRSSCSNINWQSMLILGISAFINNMYLAQFLKDLLWTKRIILHVYYPECPCISSWVCMWVEQLMYFQHFFCHLLSFEKTSKLDDMPNPYVVKTQKFPLSYWQLTFFLYEDTTFNIITTLIFELLSHFTWHLQYE